MIRVFTSPTQALGQEGECIAVKWLETQGFMVVERNVSNKFGEIDVITQKGRIYYLFEVKTGRQGGWFNPAENLTKAKLRKFLISCEYYALSKQIKDYRVQGISVLIPKNEHSNPVIEVLDLL